MGQRTTNVWWTSATATPVARPVRLIVAPLVDEGRPSVTYQWRISVIFVVHIFRFAVSHLCV